ncbi:hypothetical protein R3P38DRAFT_3227490 [Favolaschia claudopus]|uniref:Uncharacterized protein n=1 Tax=Favolaschia claudopus TaxID=2862362 RepID=A0AAV9ZT00_9AGAR
MAKATNTRKPQLRPIPSAWKNRGVRVPVKNEKGVTKVTLLKGKALREYEEEQWAKVRAAQEGSVAATSAIHAVFTRGEINVGLVEEDESLGAATAGDRTTLAASG